VSRSARSEQLDYWVTFSRCGPVEADLVASLAPTFREEIRPGGGLSMRYLVGGHGPPVVLLHGRGQSATSWHPLLPALATNHTVIAIDVPGFGHAGTAPFSSREPEAALEYFVKPLAATLRELGLEQVSLVGHSLGGFIALEIALRQNVAVDRLVLIGSLGLSPTVRPAARAYFHSNPERLMRWFGHAVARVTSAPGMRGRDTRSHRLTALEHELGAVPDGRVPAVRAFNTLCPLVGSAFHRRERLATLDVPTLLVWGERDAVLPVPVAIDAAALLPRAQLSLLPLGHSPHLEAPEQVLPILLPFLAPSAAEAETQRAG
jgi:pimeloyl-ACP methyl ester carboxylesterase